MITKKFIALAEMARLANIPEAALRRLVYDRIISPDAWQDLGASSKRVQLFDPARVPEIQREARAKRAAKAPISRTIEEAVC